MSEFQKRAKRHHIVPKTLQKQFSTEEGKIWFSEKNEKGAYSAPEYRNIASTFMKRNHYTVLEHGAPSDIIESKFYSKLDDILGKLLPQIVGAVSSGKIPQMSSDLSGMFRKIIMDMAFRSPDFTKMDSDYDLGVAYIQEVIAELGSTNLERKDELEKDLRNRTKVIQYGRDIRVRGSISPTPRLDGILKEFSFRWAFIEGRHSFVLSSQMVYRIGNGGPNGLSNPKAEVWMPLSPKVAAVMLRDQQAKIPHLVSEDRDHVRQINEYAVRSSQQIASGSQKLLQSLIN